MNGAHRPDGLYALAGPAVRALGEWDPRPICDVAPTLLALAAAPVPTGLDGTPMEPALALSVARTADAVASARSAARPFSGDEEAEVARRLAALGYLDAEPGE
jgi:arylsulfatase A-like enzyme